jgi:hypothetical protein
VTVKSLLSEPFLSAFYVPLKRRGRSNSRSDSVSHVTSEDESDVEDRTDTESDDGDERPVRLWPDVDVLFEQDVSYCDMRRRLTECIDESVDMLVNYATVSCLCAVSFVVSCLFCASSISERI